MKLDYWPIHRAAQLAGEFHKLALFHLETPRPERLEAVYRELREALDRLEERDE